MKIGTTIYKISCYFLIAIEISLLLYAVFSRIYAGEVPYYGTAYPDTSFYDTSFTILNRLEACLWVGLLVWPLLTLVVTIARRFNFNNRPVRVGLFGFLLGLVYAFWDPFGLIKYLVD